MNNTFNSSDFQLRRDVVSGNWVAFSNKRSSKVVFHRKDSVRVSDVCHDTQDCPFCNTDFSDQEQDVLIYVNKYNEWTLRVLPNKFPILSSGIQDLNHREEGVFQVMNGLGFHEVVLTIDHHRNFADLEVLEIAEILDAYQERYISLMQNKNIKYISIFTNYGKTAGASVMHPHSQIVAMPVIDPDISRSLEGSDKFFQSNKRCVHCLMLDWEKQQQVRILFENDDFIALCPFVSRVSFEIRIYPKSHFSYFERITEYQKLSLAEVMKWVLWKMRVNLDDVDYNMFLHTSPCDGSVYDYYHWHFEIFPKTNIWAGLELGSGLDVCSVLPEEAAKIIKN